MIECPKCKSKHISVVPMIKKEKNKSEGFRSIQIICITILIITFIFFAATAIDNSKAFSRFIGDNVTTQTNTSSSTNSSSGTISGGITPPTRTGLSDYETLCFCAWIMRWTLLTLLLVTFAKAIVPYRTTKEITYICHECDLHWHKPSAKNTEYENADD